jgi:glucoamylase
MALSRFSMSLSGVFVEVSFSYKKKNESRVQKKKSISEKISFNHRPMIKQIILALAPLEPWISRQLAISNSSILLNCESNGALLASTSTYEPNYAFHWVRDAALTSHTLPPSYLDRMLEFNFKIQKTSYLGEPKFYPDGNVFDGPWGRPQHDGPALRALASLDLVLGNYSRGFDNEELSRSIVLDLDHVANNLDDPGFDLWEEVKARSHFFTVLVQHCALHKGSIYFPSELYAERAEFLEKQVLPRFWDNERGYIVSNLDRVGPGLLKESNLDSSVILAILNVQKHCPESTSYSPTSIEVMSTILRLITTFRTLYPINIRYPDLCPAIGRFDL